jgi:hypothetical protein
MTPGQTPDRLAGKKLFKAHVLHKYITMLAGWQKTVQH